MKKDEILAKARAEKSDEMERFVQDRSMIWIILGIIVFLGIFSWTRLKRDMPVEDYGATIAVAASIGNIYRFIKMKNKHNLILGIIFGLSGILQTVLYFVKFLGA